MNAAAPTQINTPGPARLMSLDVFRGATIAAMMLVNNPGTWGAMYKPLDHAEWHGWTFTDLIFPFFIWIVGVATRLQCCTRTAARLLDGCKRLQPTKNTVRFVEGEVWKFIQERWPKRFHASPDAKPDRSPDAKPDKVSRTKRPVSASK